MKEKQTLTITVEFQTEHSPGTDLHLRAILENYLRAKGITLEEDFLEGTLTIKV